MLLKSLMMLTLFFPLCLALSLCCEGTGEQNYILD